MRLSAWWVAGWLTVGHAAWAQPSQSSQSSSARSPSDTVAVDYRILGEANCPTLLQLLAAVEREAGPGSVADTAPLTARLAIRAEANALLASMSFFDSNNVQRATRELTAEPHRCADVVRVFALLVAVQLQTQQALHATAKPATPVRPRVAKRTSDRNVAIEVQPEVRPTEVSGKIVEPQPEPPAVKDQPLPPPSPSMNQPVRVWLGSSGTASHDSLRWGALAGTAYGVSPHWHAILDVYWRQTQSRKLAQGSFETSNAGTAIGACWDPFTKGSTTLWMCPHLAFEYLGVTGSDVDVPASDATLLTRLGADLRLTLPLVGRWFALLNVGADYGLGTRTVYLNNTPVWSPPPTSETVVVSIGYVWNDRRK